MFCLGLAVLGTFALPLFAWVGVSRLTCLLLLAGGLAGFIRRPVIVWPKLGLPILTGLAGVLAVGFIDALAPPVDTDEIYQHLALPAQFLLSGELFGGWMHPDASRPLLVHLNWTVLMGLGGEAAPKLLHLLISGILLCGVWEVGQRHGREGTGTFAVLLLVGSYTFVREIGLAYNNLPAALACLLAMEAALDEEGWAVGVFSGIALAIKYTAAPMVGAIFLVYWIRRKGLGPWVPMLLMLMGCVVWLFPWWLRNLVGGLHPLFPYAGWSGDLAFMSPEKYGMGRAPLDFLLLPWNLTVHAETDSFRFLGRVNPLGLACLPVALVVGGRQKSLFLFAGVVAFAGWAVGPQWARHLLPASPVLALALAEGALALKAPVRWMLVGVWLLGLPGNWGPWFAGMSGRLPAAFDPDSRSAVLEQEVDGYSAAHWVHAYAPSDARVALLFSWPLYYVGRPAVLGSVEDHVPTRHFLESHGDRALSELAAMEVTHVMVSRVGFIHKSYPFLEQEEFHENYVAFEEQLEALLMAGAVKVFEDGRHSVWRLIEP